MTSSVSGVEAIAAAERTADLLIARAASGDPSAIPSVCRISGATQHSTGTFGTLVVAPLKYVPLLTW